jgi:predicted site-specific integrase-resolvase
MRATTPCRPVFQPPTNGYSPQYLSPKMAAGLTGLSVWTWRSWCYSGRIASVKTGAEKQARLLIPLSEIERVLNEGLRPALSERVEP